MQGKEGGECVLREDGTVCCWLPGGQPGDTVEFRADEYAGPSLWLDGKSLPLQAGHGKGRFEGEAEVNCAAPAPALTAWPFTENVTTFVAGSVMPAGDTTAAYCT